MWRPNSVLSSLGVITSVLVLVSCGGSSGPPSPPISLSFAGTSAQTIAQGQSVTLTVNAVNDSSGKGVSWTLSGPGSLSNKSSFSVEYAAPATVANSVTATITATDVADPSKTATDTVTVTPPPAISVSVVPPTATVPLNSSPAFTATVQNDPANAGVNWVLTQNGAACTPGCGTLSSNNSSSGSAITYTPPATLPANTTVTLTATSVTDPTKSGPATITLAPPSIVVTINAANPQVEAGSTDQLTAVVTNDPANKGVSPSSWTLSPATGAGTLTNTTSTGATYNAPATPPASDLSVTIKATSVSDPTQSGTVTITVPAISVSLNPALGALQAGSTDVVTAVVNNDPSNQGVSASSWTLSPATGAGTLTNPTTTSVTYNAPAAVPTSDLSVSISATSAADVTKSGSATIIVKAITLSAITPNSALIPLNATMNFATAVQYDPANAGANWALQQSGTACSPGCGAVAPTKTASGAPTTYTAPAAMPVSPSVVLSATSVTDSTKTVNTTFTLSSGSVEIYPNILDFGASKSRVPRTKTFTLTNTGNSALAINSVTVSSPFTQTDTCGSTVAAGASCTFTVTFTPTGVGTFVGSLTINDSSTDSPQTISLKGTVLNLRGPLLSSALVERTTAAVPVPTGSNPVGTRILDLVDATRNDPYMADGSKRELMVRVWYPATVGQDCVPAEYTSPLVWSYYSQLVGVPLPEVRTNSCLNAAVSSGSHPVLVFTPGYTATFTDYTFLYEDLASRGYVVVSVDHTNESTAVAFPDGRFVKSVFGSNLGGELRSDTESYATAVTTRLSDLTFVLNELDRLDAEADGPFANRLDTSRVALAGHSLGGMTTILSLQQEPRFKAGIVLAGVMPQGSTNATSKPVFFVTTGHEQWGNEECQVWSTFIGPRVSMDLAGADHVTPTDLVWLTKSAINTGMMSPEQTVEALRNNIAAFLDANLRAKPSFALRGASSMGYVDLFSAHQPQLACSKK